MDKLDIVIIGAGVIGLAIAWELSRKTNKTIAVVEKNQKFGQEISSRNSEVIHSGIYYPAEMLKTRLCVEGNHLLYRFCEENRVKHQRCGKLLIANSPDEIASIGQVYQQAGTNGVPAELISSNQIKKMEPLIEAQEAIYIPSTGTVDAYGLMQALYYLGQQQGVIYLFNTEVIQIDSISGGYALETPRETIMVEKVINAGGLNSDKIAARAGIDIEKHGYRLHLCKGEYFKIKKKRNINRLIYPLPGINSLGIHLSKDLEGNLRLGPNAFYIDEIDYQVDEEHGDDFYEAVQSYLPWLERDEISPDFTGIRPKLQAPGEPMQDFIISEESAQGLPGLINLVGIESPGLTACLAIAGYVREMLK
ncbi:MAG: NAD(P)/FAD-dependent oxidoreductase [Syntrophomonadaceae bacterium]|nr:NAD(P)/FAD-dependent oxidoreductase [Syntrophomonadaceae bacterium]